MARKITIDEVFYRKCKNCQKDIPCIATAKARSFFCARLNMRLGKANQAYCSKLCSMQYRNMHENPAKTESGRRKISEYAKKNGIKHLISPEAKKKQADTIRGKGHWNWQGGISHPPCVDCGKKITFKKKRCKPCDAKYRVGERSHLWKGGLSTKNALIRSSGAMRKWREEVFKRDNFTCVFCGAKAQKGVGKRVVLNADHIKPFALFPELRFLIENGRTLCEPCHRKTDTFGKNLHHYRNMPSPKR